MERLDKEPREGIVKACQSSCHVVHTRRESSKGWRGNVEVGTKAGGKSKCEEKTTRDSELGIRMLLCTSSCTC